MGHVVRVDNSAETRENPSQAGERGFQMQTLATWLLARRSTAVIASILATALGALVCALAQAQAPEKKPNILVIFGDDVGQSNISAYTHGLMGYQTPNIDRIAREGMLFTDYYAENSCTAGRSTFITGQSAWRTGLTKVGIPGAPTSPRTSTTTGLSRTPTSPRMG
jgi:Sulfatase